MGEAIADVFRALDEFLVALAALASAVAALLGIHNRRELRNGLGVSRRSKKRPPEDLTDLAPREVAEHSDEVPLRAAVDATLSFVAGIDDRLERVEEVERKREERDDAGRSGEVDRRVADG